MKVVVIGGAGYIGRPLVQLLRERLTTVSVGHRSGNGVDELVDIRCTGDVYRLLLRTKPDVVVVTAYVLDRALKADPIRAVETNVLGMTNVFQAAADLGIGRVVFASSGAVLGDRDDFGQPVDELEHCRPNTLYGKMKLFNEWVAEHYNENFGTEIVSYRISGPYGRGKPHDLIGYDVPYDTVVAAAGKQDRLVLPWSANAYFRFIHVDDAAASFLPIILSGGLRHRVYNAPGFMVSIRELAEASKSICKLDCSFSEPGRPVKCVWWDTTRYEEEFDFRPRSMEEWMREEIGSDLKAVAAPCFRLTAEGHRTSGST